MLQAITLDGFRSFPEPRTIQLGRLTALTGPNSAGKSSVIQALIALVQSADQSSRDNLVLRGDWVDLGTFEQAVSATRFGRDRSFAFGFIAGTDAATREVYLRFGQSRSAGEVENLASAAVASLLDLELAEDGQTTTIARGENGKLLLTTSDHHEEVAPLHPLSFHTGQRSIDVLSAITPGRVLYLGGYRTPPQPLYVPRPPGKGPLIGARGEHTAEAIFHHRATSVDVLPNNAAPAPLPVALDAWWAHIFQGAYRFRVDAPARLGFTLSLDTPSAEGLGLAQVGLGLSQVLPVVVLCLLSRAGDLVVVESPEAHLHPAAQHRLVELFVALVRTGRQVILETHSEHIIHALRLAVQRGGEHRGLTPEDVVVQYIRQVEGASFETRIRIDEHGRLDQWPEGFFDQSAIDLTALLSPP